MENYRYSVFPENQQMIQTNKPAGHKCSLFNTSTSNCLIHDHILYQL